MLPALSQFRRATVGAHFHRRQAYANGSGTFFRILKGSVSSLKPLSGGRASSKAAFSRAGSSFCAGRSPILSAMAEQRGNERPKDARSTPELPDDTPMDQVEFPPRIRNVLAAAGLKTVGEVRGISDDTLPSHPPVDHYRYRVPTSAGPAISDEPRDQPHDDISLLGDSRHLLVVPTQHGNSPNNVYRQAFAP